MRDSTIAGFKGLCLLALGVLLSACAGTPDYNPTTFPYELDQGKLAANSIRTVVIPHVNLGPPSRNYLEDEAPRIDGYVSAYLKENGYKVIAQREFEQRWNTAVRAYGNPVDPTTGRTNMKSFSLIMQDVRDGLVKDFNLDAFVFTDLLELEAPFSGGLKHVARWDGVTRKPAVQGPGNSISADFDWNAVAAVASLQVAIFNTDLERVFFSRGGLDATDAIDTRTERYARRRTLLENKDNIKEGIGIALHPFIEYEDWPGNP
ncbi:hypothetical protein E4634_05875 [Mangrovimicrobium sediminis]|uniref:Uncharacterized protein n=1 Tax=Mangrovimicrobium sediminis TaxID=2562682 RepID=A0A4Z0M5N3_9GAMM|nr:hypothetical protein [Haliea sp. SAOS-164]TGD74727.1 hypothetical protein E4634_05875 [Haliea sp. SAOS-164]